MADAEIAVDAEVEGVHLLDHTADSGVEIEGDSLDECLARAAAGMFAQMWARPTAPASERVVGVELEADRPDELLVAWLQELLYRSEVDALCFYRFEVESDGGRLSGRAIGVPLDPDLESVGPSVKAVTRHGLEMRRAGECWRGRVLFDV